MKKFLLFVFLVCGIYANAETERLDTAYYDKNGKGCSPTFANYYRVFSLPTDNNPQKKSRDFYLSGEVRGDADYISIDKNDDAKSIFDGEVTTYYKNGQVMKQMTWNNSLPYGEVFEFYENGNVKTHGSYNIKGLLSGYYYLFNKDGSIDKIYEYSFGRLRSYYYAYNAFGLKGKYNVSTNDIIPEQIYYTEVKTKIIKGDKYYYYDDKNGVYVSVFIDAINHYGKYYRVCISLFNNTNTPFLFEPNKISATGMFARNKKEMRVWSCKDYATKVDRRQKWNSAIVAISQAMSAANAGYSTANVTTTTYGSYGASTTYTSARIYDATAAAIAQEKAAATAATYSAHNEIDRAEINDRYLQMTTIDPQTEMTGYVLINKDKPDYIDILIPINGIAYPFHITDVPK